MKELNIKQNNQNFTEDPLLEGKYYAGGSSSGEVCFNPLECRKNMILVLRGDENIAADLQVSGFIIEDESDVLAEKLHEYFSVPVITGVPLAKKILKEGEKITLDGSSGYIYETVPFEEQIGEIEMNFMNKPLVEDEMPIEPQPEEHDELMQEIAQNLSEDFSEPEITIETKFLSKEIPDETTTTTVQKTTYIAKETPEISFTPLPESISEPEVTASIPVQESPKQDVEKRQADISHLLNIISDDTESIEIKKPVEEPVQGINKTDNLNIWGNSLEKIIKKSRTISAVTATDALETINEDQEILLNNTRELQFDKEEEYIAANIKIEEIEKNEYACVFIPTATKVYVHLVDEKLPDGFDNFDGVIFSSSLDMDIYLELLEDTLEKSQGKELLAVTPPYEKEALENFIKKVHSLRNKSHRNLSLILPDYRNKVELAEIKKLISAYGLKRSSSFSLFTNVSRTINVFRLDEITKSVADGMFIDLYRLKMNMLGVDSLTASTLYKQGMKKMTEYISQNIDDECKTIVDITGFSNTLQALDHLLRYKFWAVSCSLPSADKIKKRISNLEKKNILDSHATRPKYSPAKRR